jgi:hypothetical protein
VRKVLFAANQPFDIEFQIQRKDGLWICTRDVSQLDARAAAGR